MLAAFVLKRQQVDVTWISFETPFFSSQNAKKASELTGIPLIVQNITSVYLKMLRNPNAGYGRNMNPCTDCHALMFRLAGDIMQKEGYDFLFSGEVVGQRPMSQKKQSLRYVEKQSGMDGFILRPLSAKLLPESIPEKDGRVNRDLLLDISGRSRKPQINLARVFGISEYPAPAGGCLLTDKGYSGRLKDLFDHQDDIHESDLFLLKYGRHIRLSDRVKVIVGRDQIENKKMASLMDKNRQILICPQSFAGPRVILQRGASDNDIRQAASICVGYSKMPFGERGEVIVTTHDTSSVLSISGTDPETLASLMVY